MRGRLLSACAPVGCDPPTVIAGALRVNLLPFVVLVTIGKAARYAAVLAVALAWVGGGA